MHTQPKPSVVLFVDDVARLSRFYRELATMTVVHEANVHAILEVHGLQLVIHALPTTAEWQASERGFRACDGHDPEGNVIQVREAGG